jgi:hypothetical protein
VVVGRDDTALAVDIVLGEGDPLALQNRSLSFFDLDRLSLIACGPDHQIRLIHILGLLSVRWTLDQLHTLFLPVFDSLVKCLSVTSQPCERVEVSVFVRKHS